MQHKRRRDASQLRPQRNVMRRLRAREVSATKSTNAAQLFLQQRYSRFTLKAELNLNCDPPSPFTRHELLISAPKVAEIVAAGSFIFTLSTLGVCVVFNSGISFFFLFPCWMALILCCLRRDSSMCWVPKQKPRWSNSHCFLQQVQRQLGNHLNRQHRQFWAPSVPNTCTCVRTKTLTSNKKKEFLISASSFAVISEEPSSMKPFVCLRTRTCRRGRALWNLMKWTARCWPSVPLIWPIKYGISRIILLCFVSKVAQYKR